MTPERISVDPDPVPAGGTVRICYDFADATSPVTLELDFDPDAIADGEVTLSAEAPCQDVQIPAGAQGLLIVDKSAQSEARSVTVT